MTYSNNWFFQIFEAFFCLSYEKEDKGSHPLKEWGKPKFKYVEFSEKKFPIAWEDRIVDRFCHSGLTFKRENISRQYVILSWEDEIYYSLFDSEGKPDTKNKWTLLIQIINEYYWKIFLKKR